MAATPLQGHASAYLGLAMDSHAADALETDARRSNQEREMSDWAEKNNDHILEGHGNKFVVCHVLYSKQLPPKWEIKQSPFLLDVNKRFATLDKAKAYCEDRYKELNGQRDEITRLRADKEKLREALIDATASLVASVSLLERGGKKAAPSDNMFSQMLVDYKNSIDRARAAIREGGKDG
jgi:hypothetical protein